MILFLHFAKAQAFLSSINVSSTDHGIVKVQFVKKRADTVKINSFLGSGLFSILTVVN